MARSFNGSSDYITVSVPTSNAVDMNGSDFSVCFWFKSNGAIVSDHRFFGKGNSSGSPANGVRYEFFCNPGFADMDFAVDDDSVKSEAIDTTNTSYDDGSWHLFICERDYGTTLKLFQDGNTEVASGADGTGDVDNPLALIIGAGYSTGSTISGFIEGDFAEFAIFNRLLSGDEKVILGKRFSPLFLNPHPVLYFPLIGNRSPEIDLIEGLAGTLTGTASSAHPLMIYPKSGRGFSTPAFVKKIRDIIGNGFIPAKR